MLLLLLLVVMMMMMLGLLRVGGRASGEYKTEPPVEPVLRRRRRPGRRRPRSVSFGGSHYVVSYDNPVDLKPMTVPRPKMTLEEAAMQSMTNRVANQPRLHVRQVRDEPQIVYTRGIYRPQPVYWRGTSDSQGFSFLHNSSQDSHLKDLDRTSEDDDDEDVDEEPPGPGIDPALSTRLSPFYLYLEYDSIMNKLQLLTSPTVHRHDIFTAPTVPNFIIFH